MDYTFTIPSYQEVENEKLNYKTLYYNRKLLINVLKNNKIKLFHSLYVVKVLVYHEIS